MCLVVFSAESNSNATRFRGYELAGVTTQHVQTVDRLLVLFEETYQARVHTIIVPSNVTVYLSVY